MSTTMREIGGRWVPAIPLPAPLSVRWVCEHEWTPHVHPTGMTSQLQYDCLRCGATTDNAGVPINGAWRLRSRLGRRLFRQ